MDALNLPRIDKGVDSFELRLWCSLAMTNLTTITILRYSDSTWRLTETTYWREPPSDWSKPSTLIIDSSVTRVIAPDLSITAILDSLKGFRLDTFMTQKKIPGFRNMVGDGMSYKIEIATKGFYNLTSYDNPSHYRDGYNSHITQFLNFMKNNLGAFVQ